MEKADVCDVIYDDISSKLIYYLYTREKLDSSFVHQIFLVCRARFQL